MPPTMTVSTIRMVSGSVTRRPSIKGGVSPGFARASPHWLLENVATEILIPDDVLELLPDIAGIDFHLDPLHVRGLEGDILEEALHDGIEPSRADILGGLVDGGGDSGARLEALPGKALVAPLGGQPRGVLPGHRILRLGQDPDKALFRETLQFH